MAHTDRVAWENSAEPGRNVGEAAMAQAKPP